MDRRNWLVRASALIAGALVAQRLPAMPVTAPAFTKEQYLKALCDRLGQDIPDRTFKHTTHVYHSMFDNSPHDQYGLYWEKPVGVGSEFRVVPHLSFELPNDHGAGLTDAFYKDTLDAVVKNIRDTEGEVSLWMMRLHRDFPGYQFKATPLLFDPNDFCLRRGMLVRPKDDPSQGWLMLKAQWSTEMMQDITCVYGIDADEELYKVMREDIARELRWRKYPGAAEWDKGLANGRNDTFIFPFKG